MNRTVQVKSLVWFALGAVTMLLATLLVMQSWTAGAEPAQGREDSTFVPMEPCRLVDTRPEPNRIGPNPTLGAADTRIINAHGPNGRCDISAEAAALSLNVTALNATAAGDYLTIWAGGPMPTAASLNPASGEPPTPNGVATQLSDGGQFSIFNFVGDVDVVIDVNGYFTAEPVRTINSRLGSLGLSSLFPYDHASTCSEWALAPFCLDPTVESEREYAESVGFSIDTANYPRGTKFRLEAAVHGQPSELCVRLWNGRTDSVVSGSELCLTPALVASGGLGTFDINAIAGSTGPFEISGGQANYALQSRGAANVTVSGIQLRAVLRGS